MRGSGEKLDFSNCLFDPTKLTGNKKVQEIYPELLPYKDYTKIRKEHWQIGICISDMGSPFIKIKDHKQKIDAIYDFFGFNRFKGDLAISYEMVSAYRPCEILDISVFLIEYQNNHEFSAWLIKNTAYYQLMTALSKPQGESESDDKYWDKNFKNQERAAKLAIELKELETNLFGSAAMKTAAARSKKAKKINYNEKFSEENQVE